MYLRADTRALSLSANDIRASSFSVHRCNVNWGDCLTLDTPESTIRRRREERREERRKKQEAQRKKQEEERKKQEEKRRKQEEAAKKIAAERRVLAQKIGTEAARKSKTSLKQSWNESATAKKRRTQLQAALKRLSAPRTTHQAYVQEYVGTPFLRNVDSMSTWAVPDNQQGLTPTVATGPSTPLAVPTEEKISAPLPAEDGLRLQQAEQALQKSQACIEKAQEEVDTARKKWVYQKVVVMAHDLNHQPLLEYLSGKDQNGINGQDAQGETALHHAVAQHQFHVVQWMIERGAKMNTQDHAGCTALHRAAQGGHIDTVQFLLEQGAAIEAKDQWHCTPLHRAAQNGHTATAAFLLDRGADLEAKSLSKRTPLHLAAEAGHTATGTVLLDRGADITAKHKDGYTPLHFAAQNGHTATAELLLQRGAAITAKEKCDYTPLHWAAQEGHTATAELLLQRGADITARDQWGYSPLHRAAQNDHTAIAEFLLDRGADLEAKDQWDYTPLHRAAQNDHTATAAFLLDRGADLEAKSLSKRTPLHLAAEAGHTATGTVLLDRGADITAKHKDGYTPLHFAAQNGHTATAELLLQRGAAITAKEKCDYTPLHWAAQEGHTATAELLLQRGADITARDQWGYSPLHRAAQNDHTAIAEFLLDRGADLEAKDQWDYTPLHRAAQNDHTAIAEFLLDRGADLEAKDQWGYTPLHRAEREGQDEVATLLRAAQSPDWKPYRNIPIVVEDTTKSEAAKEDNQATSQQGVGHVPPQATTSTPSQKLKDAPALVQAQTALKTAQAAYEAAQQSLADANKAYQEAHDAFKQAQNRAKVSLQHTLTIKQPAAHLGDIEAANTTNLAATPDNPLQSSDCDSVYYNAIEEASSTTTDEDFMSACSDTVSLTDTGANAYGIWSNDALAHIAWDATLLGGETHTHTPTDIATSSSNIGETDTQAKVRARAISPPITAQGQSTSPQVSPRSVCYFFPSIGQVAQAITIPFDNRPLTPLVQAVDRICTQLKAGYWDSEQRNMDLQEGHKIIGMLQQKPYTTTLDWHERVQRKTLEDKLSCHVRLYQCLGHWIESLTEEEQQAFETVMIPILEQHFLRAPTEIQDALLTYWEQNGQCYTDLLQEVPVSDWLRLSLYRDIVYEALATNNTLLHNQFSQRLGTLAQHQQETYAQNKLLSQLLWALRTRQQAHQFDLLALCNLMEWLPTDGQQALQLLNNELPNWYPTLKAHYIRPQLAVFQDRYPTETVSELGELLAWLPWSKTITDIFLQVVAGDQDPAALKNLLLFLSKHPIEERTLLDVVLAELPEDTSSPSHYLHHTLTCELLKKPLQQFGPHTEGLYGQITTWLRDHLEAFDALYDFLSGLKSTDTTTPLHSEQALQLREVLTLLNDYGAPAAVGAQTFQVLAKAPVNQWEATTHQRVVAATFHASHELSTQEIIDRIVQYAPNVFFAGDAQKLTKSYDAIIAAYQSPASILRQVRQPIAQWSRPTVTEWAETVRKHYNTTATRKRISQGELLAVMMRAVELTHGFAPRATQLLSVLTLLNTPDKKGRLAQINTGEGKSLIVAMLAAIHALQGQKVDLLTTSIELSIPEVKKQKPFFETLGLTVGENSKKHATSDKERHAIYQKDIVYGTAEDFQADIISTEFFRRNIRDDRGFGVVLVDEVDSMLFDDRNYSTQLSSLTPAMNHLEIVLGAVWNQVNLIASRLRTINGQCYFIKTEFKDTPDGIWLPGGQTLDHCSELVDDQVAFLKQHTIAHLEKLLRKLTSREVDKLEAYEALHLRIEKLNDDITQAQREEQTSWLAKAEQEREAKREEIRESAWLQEEEYLRIPAHLQDFARAQIPRWVENAIYALLGYKKDHHYHVEEGKIVPIDYSNTGVFQHNTVWDNGLAQFLQIKEGLKVTPEGIATNFISKPGYFKRYGDRLYGLTGTLGNETTRNFLATMYGVDMITIPPYKHREIIGNEDSSYLCKELRPRLVTTSSAWYDAITESVIRLARNGQAVLVICQYINQVTQLTQKIAAQYNAKQLFTYTGEEDFEKHQIDSGEIILATNIAGRGTDLTTSSSVEDHGGLHVCITFLPTSYRVELQNAGRTARQGKKGSAQLVLRTPGETTLQGLRTQRDQEEAQAIEQAQQDVTRMITADRLFTRYCGVEASFFPKMEALEKVNLSQQLVAQWQAFAEVKLSTAVIQEGYKEHIQGCVARALAQHKEELIQSEATVGQTMQAVDDYSQEAIQKEHAALVQETRTKVQQERSLEVYRKETEEATRTDFIQEIKTKQAIPNDVLVAFLQDQVYVPPNAELATQYGWTERERYGSQERWGIWLKKDSTERRMEGAARHRRFDALKTALEDDAQRDRLIQNPYYYVQKGNELLQLGFSSLAVKAYDRAIALDELYSVNARFNKARALVTPQENRHNHDEAWQELTKAKYLIRTHARSALLSFDTLVGQTGKKPQTSAHVQHQLDMLSQQENYIQAAIEVIEKAQDEDWDVEITEVKSIEEVFEQAEGNRKQALEEVTGNGLTHVFTIKEKEPKKWWSIIAVTLIGLAQLTAGVFITVCTLGTGMSLGKALISEGVSDLITAVKAGIQGGFSWAEWGLQKAISLAVSLISAGWDSIKKGCKAIKGTVQNVGRVAAEMGKKGIKVAMQRVGVELGKGIAKECVSALVNYGTDQLLMKDIEKEIEKKVTTKVTQALKQNQWVQRALALDVKNKNNYWQNFLLQEGMALLAVKKQDKVLYALKEVAKGVASNKIVGAKAVIQGAAMAKALHEVMTLTDDFLTDFHKKIERDYKREIQQAEEESQKIEAQKQQEAAQQQVSQTISTVPPPIDEDDLEIPIITIQADYKSDLRDCYYETPSHANNLYGAFSGAITNRITNKIQGDMIRPATGALVNMGIDKMLERVEATVKKNEEDFCDEGKQYYQANELGNESKKEGEKKNKQEDTQEEKEKMGADQEDTGDDKTAADNPPTSDKAKEQDDKQPMDPANKAMANKVRSGAEGGIAEAGAAAAELGCPIAIYDEHGKLLEIVGREQKGPLLQVQHIPNAAGTAGHYIPYGKQEKAATSGPNNCLYDALACQTDQLASGDALREKVAQRLETSTHTAALHQAVETLRAHNPSALREGGKVLEWVHPEYLYYRYQGDAVKAQAIKDRCERVEDVLVAGLTDPVLFGGGVGNALGNNLTLGVVPRGDLSASAFVYGQQVGDGLSIGIGAAETWLGRGMIGGGGVAIATTGGITVPVGVPVIAGGAVMTTHGSVVMSKALLEFAKHKEGEFKGRKQSQGKYVKAPPGKLTKLRGSQGWKDKKGNIWRKDMKHKDHWDVIDPKTGKKIKEIDFDGNRIWPQGPKNKSKK